MVRVFNSENRYSPGEEVVGIIMKEIIHKDYKFLVANKFGRPRGKEYGSASKFDPWMSHLHSYAGELKPLAIPEFNQMFLDIRKYLCDQIASGKLKINFNYVPTETEQKGTEYPEIGNALSLTAKKWEEKHGGSFFEVFGVKIKS